MEHRYDPPSDSEGPSLEDFWDAEEEQPDGGPRSTLIRILRAVGVAIVILALLAYFIGVPFNSIFSSMPFHMWRPERGLFRIPLAPEHKSVPKLPA